MTKTIIEVVNKLNLKLFEISLLTASPTMQIRAIKNLQPINHQKTLILGLFLMLNFANKRLFSLFLVYLRQFDVQF